MKARRYITATLINLLFIAIWYYIAFPAINIHNIDFLFWLLILCAIMGSVYLVTEFSMRNGNIVTLMKHKWRINMFSVPFFFYSICGIIILIMFIGGISSAEFFRARSYASLLEVNECSFTDDIEESENISNIALMDTKSAIIFGNRKIGSLSDVISQFEVEENYTQINMNGEPMKVAPLKYANFFKYWKNKKNGIPGYVKVNPVNSNADYIKLNKGMKYISSGYFNNNIARHVQMKYPTKIIYNYYFEVSSEGIPYYSCPVVSSHVGLFGGYDVVGTIICDPIDGSCQYYNKGEIPQWVNRVYDGKLLGKKYNWYGLLSGGYWNSIISQTGCKQITDDYGYKTIEEDVWIYTGVTSVTGDESNVGFIMMNQRTSEARYYNISGAEEYSAMASAEGEVQEKGYRASFPSLINVAGQPTYIMVLKDNAGLVKMYAMVNVEQYNIVVTASTQEEVFSSYKKVLFNSLNSEGTKINTENNILMNKEITVTAVEFITIEGNTTVYIKDENNQVYKQLFAESEDLIKLSVGQKVQVEYEEMEDGIHFLSQFTMLPF